MFITLYNSKISRISVITNSAKVTVKNLKKKKTKSLKTKVGGLDLSRRGLDQDLDLDAKKESVSTVEKISTVSKS
jgi:hypothetical protein